MAGIEEIREAWDRLAHSGTMTPTADAAWMASFWSAFGNIDRDLVIHALYCGDQLVAVVPMRRRGRWVRTWRSVRNPENPCWAFCMDESRPELAEAILDHLLESVEYIDLLAFHRDTIYYEALTSAARRRKLPMWEAELAGDALSDLPGSAVEAPPLSKNLTKNCQKAQRQLEKLGTLTFDLMSGGPGMMELLEECFRLEASGWKGTHGNPILRDPAMRAFYERLAEAEAAHGRLALYTLRLDGRLLAFEYCIRGQGRIYALKSAYDPEFAQFSPSNLLRFFIFRKESADGVCQTYHYGRPSEWKMRWANRVRPLVRLRIYSGRPRSRLAYWSGPRLRGFAKRVLARFRPARELGLSAPGR